MARSLRLLDNETGVVEVSSRTLHGRFLMRPSAKVNELILGVLGRAQRKYGVELFAFVFLSNHFHILMRVLSGQQMAGFVGFLKGNLAKELGHLLDWREKFWGRRYHSASVADSEQAQAVRFSYIVANGCKEGLVASPLDWPGVSSVSALYGGESTLEGTWYDRTAEYRARIRGERRSFPCSETVQLSPLPFLKGLTGDQQRKYVVDAVHQVEAETRHRHKKNRSRPLGARNVEKQHPHQKPDVFVRSPAPLFLTATREEHWRMRAVREQTVAAYRRAAERLRRGEPDVRFPVGSFPPPAPFVRMRAPP